jgi:hypothetical protein
VDEYDVDAQGGVNVTDIVIEDVPDNVLKAIDAKAARLGISRNELLLRQVTEIAEPGFPSLTVEDLRAFSEAFADLSDPEIMRKAWE